MTALQSVVRAIMRSGTSNAWRVDAATFQEMVDELYANRGSRLNPLLCGPSGWPIVCGVEVGVWGSSRTFSATTEES